MMLRPLNPSPLTPCLRQQTALFKRAPGLSLVLPKRHKHGRDFPRNVPPPPPPTGPKLFSSPTMTLYHSPAPSAPTYKTTPLSFLPASAPYDPTTQSSLVSLCTQMPPPLQTRRPREKKYHLSEEDVAEIRRLRFHPDPAQRKSRRELARMFGCGEIFVGMAAPLGKEEVSSKREEEEKGRRWGERKKFVREVRKKAREEWFKGED